jgi:hypothetical protein
MAIYCSKCGSHSGNGLSFCRKCGASLEGASLARTGKSSPAKRGGDAVTKRAAAADPDELLANGIGAAIVGDGFFITAVILSATHTSISSLLWLLLLIPAFYCFGRGFKDILHARQIRRRQKQAQLNAAPPTELPPPRASVADFIRTHTSADLLPLPRPPKSTTGDL